MILASHGIIGSSIVQFDADALAFFARVDSATSTTDFLTTTEKTAINKLVLDLKANSLWTPMKAIYPMVGASAAACAQNLKSSSFTGTFTSGWTFASTGATPNGTSAYMDTGFNNQGDWTSTSNGSMGLVSRTNTIGPYCDMGSGVNIFNGANSSTMYIRYDSDFFYSGLNCTSVVPGSSNDNSIGFFVTSRTSSTTYTRHKRGTSTINTSVSNSIGTNPNKTIYLGAGNNVNTDSPFNFSNREYDFVFIGDGLTQTEVDDFYNVALTFNNSLSR